MSQPTALPLGKNRIIYFDYLESLAIYFVTSLHYYTLQSTEITSVVWFLYRTCIPLFFMVHGALMLEREQSLSQILHRLVKLLLQLFGWNLFYLLLSLAIGLLQPQQITLGLLYRVFLNTEDSGGIPSFHLWFSYALISVYLALPVIQVCKKHAPKVLRYILIVCFLFGVLRMLAYAYGTFLGQLWFGSSITLDEFCRQLDPFGQYTIHLFYFIWGWYLYRWLQTRTDRRRLLFSSIALFLIGELLMLVEQVMAHGKIAFADGLSAEYQRLGIVLMSTALFLFFSQLNLKRCPLNAAARFLSVHTLDIYYLHIIYARLLSTVISAHGWSGLPFNALRALVILLLALASGLLLRRIPVLRRLLV